MDWISLHIHFHGELDALLLDAVRPLLDELRAAGDVQAAFFIRYWNGGQHLRLRLMPGDGRSAESLTALSSERLGRYVAAHAEVAPSPEKYRREADLMSAFRERLTRDEPLTAAHLELELPYRADQAVVVASYAFDEERFGGPAAREIAEEHFCRSSELALDLLERTRGDRPARLTRALVLMSAAACALALTDQQAFALFERYCAVGDVVLGQSHADYPALLRLPRPEEQWETIEGAVKAAQGGPGAAWRAHLGDCVRRLHDLDLATRADQILLDYVHLLNNRLGIPLMQELYLSHLLARWYGRTEGR